MKNLLILIICVTLSLSSCAYLPNDIDNTKNTLSLYDEIPKETQKSFGEERTLAMWISQYDIALMCLKDGNPRSVDEYHSRVSLMVARLLSLGINTIFVQTRPNGDSLYHSDIFPPSAYASGELGVACKYDTFGIIVDQAVQANISVHAWINPLRLMKASEIHKMDKKYTLGKWAQNFMGTRIVTVGEYCYLDPAYPEVRRLITDGAIEIMEKYAVDGIHIDDYFYPTVSPDFDADSYSLFGKGTSLGDFRRSNITQLVSELHSAAAPRGRIFGISPSGNSKRNYDELYADIEEWCKRGVIDYLCPQIYFGIEHETFPFEKTVQEFYRVCNENGIYMIVGLTLEKAQNGFDGTVDIYAGSGKNEWIDNKDVLARCADIAISLGCDGLAFFSYRLFYSPSSFSENEATREERDALFEFLKMG